MNIAEKYDPGLLEYLAAKAGCMYLSDLHQPMYSLMLGHIIRGMEIERFSLMEWNDAVQYITGKTKNFAAREEAAAYLQRYEPVNGEKRL